MQRIWITGYRSYELNVFKDDDPKVEVIKKVLTAHLKSYLERDEDECWLITGPQMGVERWVLECGLALREDYPQIRLALMEPYTEFDKRWNEGNQEKLAMIKDKVDFTAAVTNHPYQSPRQLRTYQQFMLTHTDEALLVYDSEYAGKSQYDYRRIRSYQEEHDYPLAMVDFDELQEAAVEWQEEQRERKNR